MKCKYCSNEIPEYSVYCLWCGERVAKKRRERDAEVSVPVPKKVASGYRIQLRLDGKSIPITRPTAKECIAEAKAVKAGVIEAKKKPETLTLHEAIDRYIESKNAVLSPETVRGYRVIQRNRFPELMGMRIGDITPALAQSAVNDATKRLAGKTVYSSWSLCNTVIGEYAGARLTVRTAQVVSEEHTWLMPEEILRFCRLIHGEECELGALLALSSLRASEIFALTWDNIDLEHRLIHVRGALVRDEHCRLVRKKQNKNASSRRDVPIMMNRLYDLLSACPDKTGAVFTTAPDTLRKRIRRICERNGLPPCGTHSLRHSFASLSASLQIPLVVTQRIGGWSNDRIMLKIYTHVAEIDVAYSKNKMAEYYNFAYEMLTP